VRFYFSAGESSGDEYAAKLMEEMRKLSPKVAFRFEGVGGTQMKRAGAYMVADSSKWGAIGVASALKVAPRVIRGGIKAKKLLQRGEPGVFIPIDFGFFNVRLAKAARAAGWSVLYFMPPGSWRRRAQGDGLADITDEIVTPFSWSAALLSTQGARAHWYGHPMKQIIEQMNIPDEHDESTSIAILPGSRVQEIRMNIGAIAEAVEKVSPNFTLEIAVASSISPDYMRQLWKRHSKSKHKVVFTQGNTIQVLKRARAGIICSGTATLQAALCRCPHVCIYRLSWMSVMEARIVGLRPEFIALPNVILRKKVVPELIHKSASPKAIAIELLKIIANGPERDAQLDGFYEMESELGGSDAITKTASLAMKLMLSP